MHHIYQNNIFYSLRASALRRTKINANLHAVIQWFIGWESEICVIFCLSTKAIILDEHSLYYSIVETDGTYQCRI